MIVNPSDSDEPQPSNTKPTSRRLSRVLDRGPVGFVITNKSGVIDWINETLLEWLGYESSELTGRRTFQQLLSPGGRIYYDTHVRPLLHMHDVANEIALELVCADRQRIPVLINASLVYDEQTGEETIETFVIDATRRREYETELLRERQLAERSEARLQVMYETASGLTGAETVEEIIAVVTERASRSMHGARCAIWLIEPDEQGASRAGPTADGELQQSSTLEFPHGGRGFDELASGQVVVVTNRDDAQQVYPLICQRMAEIGMRSAAVAPLIIDGRLYGVISYGYELAHTFDDADLQAARSLARQTEQGLLRANSIEAERRNKRHLASLHEFTTELSAALTIGEVLDALVEHGQRSLGAVGTRVALLDDAGTSVQFVRSGGLDDELRLHLPLHRRSIACAAIRTNQPVVVDSRQELEKLYPESPILDHPSFGRAMAMPLRRGSEVLGAWVLVDNESEPSDAIDVTLFELFAEQAGQATQRAAMHEAADLARAQADVRSLVSTALNRAVTTSDVGRAITVQGRSAFGAAALAFWVADPNDPTMLQLETQYGLDTTVVETVGKIPLDDDLVRLLSGPGMPAFVVGLSDFDELLDDALGTDRRGAAAVLPLNVAGRVLGLIAIGFDRPDALSPSTRVALSGLAGVANVALVRARRYDVDHDVATTLQRSLRPSIGPLGEGWMLTTSYTPWSELLEVGGDLFDVTSFDNGRLVLVVGDVVGHGLEAAAAMGLLRSAAKMLTLVATSPAEVIEGLHAFAKVTPAVLYSSICCVEVQANGAGRYACAGHPFPVVRRHGGRTEVLEEGRSSLLGIGDTTPPEATFTMDIGSSIVLYSDGLIERKGVVADVGVDRLRQHLGAAGDSVGEVGAEEIARAMLGGEDPDDDVVVVCLTRAS